MYFSHNLVFYLLGNYFLDDLRFLLVNSKVENLLKKVIGLSRPLFKEEYFLGGLKLVKLKNPLENVRSCFKLYFPQIRESDKKRGDDLNLLTLTDQEYREELYMCSLNFWADIVEIAKLVDHSRESSFQKKYISKRLKDMNKYLPSFVYIPSASIQYR